MFNAVLASVTAITVAIIPLVWQNRNARLEESELQIEKLKEESQLQIEMLRAELSKLSSNLVAIQKEKNELRSSLKQNPTPPIKAPDKEASKNDARDRPTHPGDPDKTEGIGAQIAPVFGPLKRKPDGDIGTMFRCYALGGGCFAKLSAYHCENNSDRVTCAFSVTRTLQGAADVGATEWWSDNKLVDASGDDHALLKSYYLTSRGEVRETMNLGQNEPRVLVQEFRGRISVGGDVRIANSIVGDQIINVPVR